MSTPEPLQALIARHTLALRRAPTRATPDAARCLVVEKVAALSVAGRAGIAPGDLLVSVNGQPAGALDPELEARGAKLRAFLFFRPAAGERVTIEATGIDIGVTVRATPKAVAANYKSETLDPGPLLSLWEQGEWFTLERLSSQLLGRTGRGHPALLLLGAAGYEAGRHASSFALVREYLSQHAAKWTQDYTALATYYVARELQRSGRALEALSSLEAAFEHFPCPRIADAIEEQTGSRPQPPRRWIGKTLPFAYHLPGLEGGPEVSLPESLARLAPGQVLIVCLLVNYRGNGPYGSFMRRYREFTSCFGSYFGGLHVITSEKERRQDRPYWYEAEDLVRKEGLPLTLAWDPEDVIALEFDPPGSPFVLLLDRRAKVHSEGELMGRELWEALESAELDR